MDKSLVQKIIRRELNRYRKLLSLQDWTITIKYNWIGDEDDATCGDCEANPNYKTAAITINPDMAANEKELIHTLRHEMFHILHASFETYRNTVEKLITDKEFKAVEEVFDRCREDLVMCLESMFDKGLKIPLEKKKIIRKK